MQNKLYQRYSTNMKANVEQYYYNFHDHPKENDPEKTQGINSEVALLVHL
jgi:hypothetical protein